MKKTNTILSRTGFSVAFMASAIPHDNDHQYVLDSTG